MRAIVADGHCATRLGVRHVLSPGDIRIVGETGEGEEVLRLIEELRPDLVVLGLNLESDADGIEVLRRLKALPDPPRVLVYTVYNFTDDVVSCFLAGAEGFVHKSASREDLLDAARRVASGERVRILGKRVGAPRSRVRATPTGECLTDREAEIAVLMLHGFSNIEIAKKLHLGLPTVKSHVKSVLRKSGARNRWELIRVREGRANYKTVSRERTPET